MSHKTSANLQVLQDSASFHFELLYFEGIAHTVNDAFEGKTPIRL